jgi:hypothetical protein
MGMPWPYGWRWGAGAIAMLMVDDGSCVRLA